MAEVREIATSQRLSRRHRGPGSFGMV
jgi:hypothetical protein